MLASLVVQPISRHIGPLCVLLRWGALSCEWSCDSSQFQDLGKQKSTYHVWFGERQCQTQHVVWLNAWQGHQILLFFSEPTVTMGLYKDMVELYAVLHLPCETLIQQDGESPHYSHVMRKHLHHTVSGGCVSKGTSVAWPPRSPDITPLDLFPVGLCG